MFEYKHFLFTIIMATTAGVHAADPVKVIASQQKVLSSPSGRFVFGQISDFRRDQYLLDTQSGKVWQIVMRKAKNPDGSEAPGDGFIVLDPVPFLDANGRMGLAPQ